MSLGYLNNSDQVSPVVKESIKNQLDLPTYYLDHKTILLNTRNKESTSFKYSTRQIPMS